MNEWNAACNLRDSYWLYMVYGCATVAPPPGSGPGSVLQACWARSNPDPDLGRRGSGGGGAVAAEWQFHDTSRPSMRKKTGMTEHSVRIPEGECDGGERRSPVAEDDLMDEMTRQPHEQEMRKSRVRVWIT